MDEQEKVFVFPEEVQSDYNVMNGISLKNLVLIVIPFAAIGLGIILIPPYTVFLVTIRVIIGILIGSIGLAIVLMKPIPERPNITILKWLRHQQAFKDRQKLYYVKTKQKKRFLEW